MEMFKHFGIDLNNDTISQILAKATEAGLGNIQIVPKNADDSPLGMLLILNELEAIPYVEEALNQYDRDKEGQDA